MLKNKYHLYGDELMEVPAHLQYGKYLFQMIKAQKAKPAIINAESGETLSYEELTQKVVDIALSLSRMGIKKGDVVGICSEKNLNTIPSILAIACVGAVCCAVDYTSGEAFILHRLKLANPKLIFCSADSYDAYKKSFAMIPGLDHFIVYGDKQREGAILFQDFVTEHAEIDDFQPTPVTAEDTVIILYSTGTTGLAKGISVSSREYLTRIKSLVYSSLYKANMVLCTSEWYLSYGLSFILRCMATGATVIYCPKNDTPRFLDAIQAYKVQIIRLAPLTLLELVKSPIINQRDVSSTEFILSSSTLCNAELINEAKTKFPNLQKVFQLYGMSEVGMLATDQKAPKGIKFGSIGVVSPGLQIKVVDLETRVPLGPKQRGELCVKSVSYTPRYINLISTNHLDEEGFFLTGDVAYYDEDGYIFLVDRIKELIKFNSFTIAPAELEAVLENHPQVQEVGVVGAPHPQYGEQPTAFVVLQPGATVSPEELNKYFDGQVSYRMRLAGGIHFLKRLPRVSAGKLDRKALKLHLKN